MITLYTGGELVRLLSQAETDANREERASRLLTRPLRPPEWLTRRLQSMPRAKMITKVLPSVPSSDHDPPDVLRVA